MSDYIQECNDKGVCYQCGAPMEVTLQNRDGSQVLHCSALLRIGVRAHTPRAQACPTPCT